MEPQNTITCIGESQYYNVPSAIARKKNSAIAEIAGTKATREECRKMAGKVERNQKRWRKQRSSAISGVANPLELVRVLADQNYRFQLFLKAWSRFIFLMPQHIGILFYIKISLYINLLRASTGGICVNYFQLRE